MSFTLAEEAGGAIGPRSTLGSTPALHIIREPSVAALPDWFSKDEGSCLFDKSGAGDANCPLKKEEVGHACAAANAFDASAGCSLSGERGHACAAVVAFDASAGCS